ncbi:MAG TPA: MFS transporter [Acidiferrobacterales bacterium]|nr:MFS transporter [Acidiferrobacterales bacterium]
MTDRHAILAATFLRALATGMMGVLLGLYLERLAYTPTEIGLVIGAGLAGAALSAAVVTFFGDVLGRRRSLLILSFAAASGGFALLVSVNLWVVCGVAFLGMLNGMGRDRGAALVLEQAILPGIVAPERRTQAFAGYNVLQDIGHALGGLLAALPTLARSLFDIGELGSFQAAIAVYAVLLLASAMLYLRLTTTVEVQQLKPALQLAPHSRKVLWRISTLFALDSFAGGFLGTALLAYFFHMQFGASETAIALLFFLARAANAASHFAAAWLAARIGLVNTMVFTHIPSSLLLMAVPFAPTFGIAALLFLLRECLVEMDVPTRQSYVMAVVRPEERTMASGVTHLVRMGGWAVAPFLAGPLMQGLALATPLLVGAGLKIVYDIALYRAFRHLKPPEEQANGQRVN